jgi:general secretion pathway protein G
MKTQNRRRRAQAGVTLIEMMVVVIIISLFAVLVGPKLFQQTDKARVAITACFPPRSRDWTRCGLI